MTHIRVHYIVSKRLDVFLVYLLRLVVEYLSVECMIAYFPILQYGYETVRCIVISFSSKCVELLLRTIKHVVCRENGCHDGLDLLHQHGCREKECVGVPTGIEGAWDTYQVRVL